MLSGSSYSLPLWDVSFHPKISSELCWIPVLAWLVQTNIAFSCLHFLPETRVLLLRHPLTNKQCVSVQKCPWWQIIHYTWMNEINSLCLFPTTLTLWEKSPIPFIGLSLNNMIEYQHFLLLRPSNPWVTEPGHFLWEGPKYFGNVFSMLFASKNLTQEIKQLHCAGHGGIQGWLKQGF